MNKIAYERAEILVSVFKKEDVVTASIVPEEPFTPEISTGSNDLEMLPFG